MYAVSWKKGATRFLSFTSPVAGWFSQFFYLWTQQKICNKRIEIAPHQKCVAALPYEMLTSENQWQSETYIVINDKSQSGVPVCLRCGGTFDYYFITGLLLCLLWKDF